MSAGDLVGVLIKDDDSVPLAVIEECARRGEEMEALLAPILLGTPELSWLPLHALNILGLIPTRSSGELLLAAMQKLYADDPDFGAEADGY